MADWEEMSVKAFNDLQHTTTPLGHNIKTADTWNE